MPDEFDVYPIVEALDPLDDDAWEVVDTTPLGILVTRCRTIGPWRVKELAFLTHVSTGVYRVSSHLFLREE